MKISAILYWLIAISLAAATSYLYSPTVSTMLTAGILQLGLNILVAWSAPRLGKGMRGGILIMAIAVVTGFMFSQGLDVAYSVLAAPAGLRFNAFIEVTLAAIYFLVLALVARVLLARPKIEK